MKEEIYTDEFLQRNSPYSALNRGIKRNFNSMDFEKEQSIIDQILKKPRIKNDGKSPISVSSMFRIEGLNKNPYGGIE
jgi:hypothetical protein